jgi:hypothetical protein
VRNIRQLHSELSPLIGQDAIWEKMDELVLVMSAWGTAGWPHGSRCFLSDIPKIVATLKIRWSPLLAVRLTGPESTRYLEEGNWQMVEMKEGEISFTRQPESPPAFE